MSRQIVDIGVQGNDGTGDSIRESFRKVNENFQELYSVFLEEGAFTFQDLSNVPDTLEPNRIITTDNSGKNVLARELVSGGGIEINIDDPAKIEIKSTGGSINSDPLPTLGGQLNANGLIIANLAAPDAEKVKLFNDLRARQGASTTIDDLAIPKGYADRRYLRRSGGSASGQIRVRQEPTTRNEYTLTIGSYVNNNIYIANHGFDSSIDGSSFVYRSTGTDATGFKSSLVLTASANLDIGRTYQIVATGTNNFTLSGAARNQIGEIFKATAVTSTDGTSIAKPVYFLKYVNSNELSAHLSFEDAQTGINKIELSGGTGVQTLIDAYYQSSLSGNWVSNEVLPRSSVVRRQGDTMAGALYLSDHPGALTGSGTPVGDDDLQAATKYYVDSSSFASTVNLYVSTVGDDVQLNAPLGKEGRAWAYAFRTLGKACEKAEYLIKNAPYETGPYRQLITYNNSISKSIVLGTAPGVNGTLEITFTNQNGTKPVDQGATNNIDITPGKLLKGRTSGAYGFIYSYNGPNGTDGDSINLQNVSGTFLEGENLEFGDSVKTINITIYVESGIYDEDYPIKVPANTSILGDEFRRTLIRPKDRVSQSSWADTWFFRNSEFDGLNIAVGGRFDSALAGWYGYHYLKDPSKLPNLGISYDNIGGYTTAAAAIRAAKQTIANGTVTYINQKLEPSFLTNLESVKSKRDTGYIVEAIATDLVNGGQEQILKLQSIFSEVTLNSFCRQGMNNISNYINTYIIASESSTVKTLVTNMITKLMFAFDANYNAPKNNRDMDVFLCNDATIIRQITCQGHGGFMMVLDPEGQILTKSPYCQQSASFSAGINKQAFRGGQFIDGFAGNIPATVTRITQSNAVNLTATGFPKEILTPTSFFIDGNRYKINSWIPADNGRPNASNLIRQNKNSLQAQTLVYLTTLGTKYAFGNMERNIDQIINGLVFDLNTNGNIKTLAASRRLFNLGTMTLRSANNKTLILAAIDKINTLALDIIQNSSNSPASESGSVTFINTRLQEIKNAVNGLGFATTVNPTFKIVLDNSTPLDSNFIPTGSSTITIVTGGNNSMLSNDYTQVNDLGYGIVTNNNGLAEAVSLFTYYCWTSYFSNNGGQIRSLNGSTANGQYGLVAAGSDPVEVPDLVDLADDMVQVARVYKAGDFATYSKEKSLSIYIKDYQYTPYNVSTIEINHGAVKGIVRYEMSNAKLVTDSQNPSVGPILQLNFNTSGNNDTSTSGLIADLVNDQLITIRGSQNFKFNNVVDTNPTRPSTALTFLGDAADDASAPVYRVIAYNTKDPSASGSDLGINKNQAPYVGSPYWTKGSLGAGITSRGNWNSSTTYVPNDGVTYNSDTWIARNPSQSILTFDATYNYIQVSVKKNRVNTADSLNAGKTLGYTAGDVRIAIDKIESTKDNARLNTGQMLFAWDGKIHRVVSYTTPSPTADYAIITISDVSSTGSPLTDLNTVKIPGLHSSVHSTTNNTLNEEQTVILKPGLAKTEEASVVIKISTMRATGHDFLDVGTGGYNASNYPNRIYGAPLTPKSQSNEVQERTRGRVFYVSTDQDGFFRVGRFFTVDQGTGTVKFAASIALSNLDGLGFKRGVAVSEFSTDDVFLNPATDVVPVQQAVYNYVNKRLGMNDKGANVDSIGPGFLDRQGINGPKNDIDWKGYNIIGLPTVDELSPISAATNKNYVDIETVKFSELDRLKNVVLTNPKRADVLAFIGSLNGSVNAEVTGDLTATLVSPITTKLKIAIGTVSISSLTVEDASLFPDLGYVQIGNEVFRYSTRTTRANPLLAPGATGTEKLDGITRLSLSTTKNAKFTSNAVAVSHSVNELVVSLNQSQIDLQINPDTIIDADVKSDADILQSKLKLNLAQIKLAAPTGTAAAKQAGSGLSSFNSSNFAVTDGWVSIKTGGVAKSNIESIASNTLLGNLETTTSSPAESTLEEVYKRTIWNLFGTNDLNTNYSLSFVLGSTQAASVFSTTEISNTVTNNSIVKRSSNGSIKVGKIDTNGGITIINASGTSDNATPVAYKGQWSPEFNATFRATDLAGGAAGSIPYQTDVGTTSMLGIGPTDTALLSNGSTLYWGAVSTGGGTVTSKILSITLRDGSTTNIDISNNSLAVTLRNSSTVNLTISNNLLPVTLHDGSSITNVNITVSQYAVSSVKLPITLHDGSTINLTLRSV
jgi:hypothetical protein